MKTLGLAQGSQKTLFNYVSVIYGLAFSLAFFLRPFPEHPWFGLVQFGMACYVFSGFIWQRFLSENTMLLYVSLVVFASMFPLMFRNGLPVYIGLHMATLCLILAMTLPILKGYIICTLACLTALFVPVLLQWVEISAEYVQWSVYLFLSCPIFLLAVYQFRVRAEELVLSSQKAERMTKQFLSNTSHELKTPLNGIMCINEVLSHRALPQDAKELLLLSHNAIQHLDFLIDELLDLSQLENHNFTPKIQPFEMSDVLFRLLKQYEHMAIVKGMDIDYDFNIPVEMHFLGDPKCLFKIYRALLDNAVKFSTQGQIKVMQQVHHLDGATANIVFSVKDNGPGIDQAFQEEIFKPFFMIDGTLTRRQEGMGLGLTMAKMLTESMAGTIYVDSTLGQGATFTVEIPLQVTMEAIKSLDKHNAASEENILNDKHMLILSDDTRVTEHFQNVMLLSGASVDNESSVLDVLKHLQKQQVDLVFVVVNNVNAQHYESLQLLRNQHPALPIMGILTTDSLEGVSKAYSAGMNGYISTEMNDQLALSIVCNCLKAYSSVLPHTQGVQA